MSVLKKISIAKIKKSNEDQSNPKKWLHTPKQLQQRDLVYYSKYLGTVEVEKSKGVDIVKNAIRKLKIAHQVKKSEAGHKGSKLPKVELHISIQSVKILDVKTKAMICSRPLHRVSYCADDHADKNLFAFIAKEQETKTHHCFVLICEKEASELTLSFGQVFQMAYKKYMESEKFELKKNKEVIDLSKQIEAMKNENSKLKNELRQKTESEETNENTSAIYAAISRPSSRSDHLSTASNPWPVSPREITNGNIFEDSLVDSPRMNEISAEFPLEPENAPSSGFPFGANSPTEKDFDTKYDPFADTPDWGSVASEEHNSTNPFHDSNNDVFSAYLENVASRRTEVNNPFNQSTSSELDEFFGGRTTPDNTSLKKPAESTPLQVSSAQSTPSQTSQSFRPRPTGSGVKNQILPPPPTKSSIKSVVQQHEVNNNTEMKQRAFTISTPTNHKQPNVQPTNHMLPNVQPTNHMQPNVQPTNHMLPNVQPTNHMLPNVQRQETSGDFRARSRTSLSAKQLNSISQISKSLEDLAGAID